MSASSMEVVFRKTTPSTPNNDILLRAANYFLRKLLTIKVEDTLKVTLSLCGMPAGVRGDAIMTSETRGQIRVNKNQDFLTQLSTIAHEVVHIKQYAQGDLDSSSTWKWQGKEIVTGKHELQPWEREAYALEATLAQSFLQEEFASQHIDRQQRHAKL